MNIFNGRLAKKDRVVSAERFSLVDAKGQERAVLGFSPGGNPGMMMARKDGTPALLLGFDEASQAPAIAIMDSRGDERLTLQLIEINGLECPVLFMRGVDGAPVITAGVSDDDQAGFVLGQINLADIYDLRAEQFEKQGPEETETKERE